MADETIPTPQAPAAPEQALLPVINTHVEITTPAEISAPSAEPATTPLRSTLLGVDPEVKTDKKIEAKPEVKTVEKPVETKVETPKTEDAKKDASVEAVKAPEQKKEEAVQSAEVAPTKPTYDALKLPEGLTPDDIKLGAVTDILADMELAKGDHAKMQELGQKLIDQSIAHTQEVLVKQINHYIGLHNQQVETWETAFMNDPEIGGNRKDTTINAANEFIKTHGGNADQQKQLREILHSSGLGSNPAVLRTFAKAMANMAEGSPVPAKAPVPQATSKISKRYGETG